MNEQNKSDEKSPQVTSGLTIIAVMLGLFFLQDSTLNPTRPGMINTDKWFTENIRARLWQDPFEVVNEHISKNYTNKNQYQNLVEHFSGKKTDKEVFREFTKHPFPANPEEAIENDQHPMHVCYRNDLYEINEEAAHSIKELGCQIASPDANTIVSNKNKPGDINILAVMVPGGPYAEDRETRLRSRYAITAALLAQGYAPEDADHIGFVHFAKFCRKTINKTGRIQAEAEKKETPDICNMPTVMPYEWFNAHMNDPEAIKQAENRTSRVLVLWLDNDAFYRTDKPLYMIGLLNYLITTAYEETSEIDKKNHNKPDTSQKKINFHVIGPSNSDTLEKIYQEVSRLETDIRSKNYYRYLNNNYLYTASATVQKQHLSGNYKEIYSTAGFLKRSIFKKNIDWLDKTIVRTIGTQDKVARTILCELALRGVTPYPFKGKENNIKKECGLTDLKFDESGKPSQIALIGEADTYYAMMLMRSISNQIQEFDSFTNESKDKDSRNVHFFKYLRGLDGITSQNTSSNQYKEKNQEHKASNPNEKEMNALSARPTGNSQLDYLLSLGANLKQLEKRNIAEGNGPFKAIGIIGSDAYDKLLILQALRNKFPGIPFFTTDLDARFLHSSEIKWTRNLIVVSPFGLRLNEQIQKFSPPFRDNFQTSLYLSTLLAINCIDGFKQCEESVHEPPKGWIEHPRVFEIGNYEAVDLSHLRNETFLDPRLQHKLDPPDLYTVVTMVVIILFTILVFYCFKPYYYYQKYIFIFAAIFLAFLFKLSTFEVALGITLLAVCLIFFIPKQFHMSLGISTVTTLFFLSAYEWINWVWIDQKLDYGIEPISFTNGISSWPANALRLLAVLLASFFLWRTYRLIKTNREEIQEEFILSSNTPVYKNHVENKIVKKEHWILRLSIDNWNISDHDFNVIWYKYLEKSRLLYFSLSRIFFMFIFFAFFVYFIFKFGSNTYLIPPSPFRGEFNYHVTLSIFFLTATLYLALTLYIADNVHLSSHLIKLLANQSSIVWPVKLIEIYKNKYDLPENIIQYKILFDFIHRHTVIHNKFIFYPFICLFLIIMSRNHYFDNWLITPFLVHIYLFFALVTLMSALRLRAAAMYAKNEILKRLNTNSAQSPIYEWQHRRNDNIVKLKSLVSEIENFKEGIFKPLLHHPMILSLLMPFSSVGGVYLIEYLL